jgi:hypothetical protein
MDLVTCGCSTEEPRFNWKVETGWGAGETVIEDAGTWGKHLLGDLQI